MGNSLRVDMEQEGRLAVFGYALKDPLALCHACGTRGTVGRAIRKQDDREVFHAQYCTTCWPAESERLRTQWDGEMSAWLDRGMTSVEPAHAPFSASAMGAATWHGVEAFVRDQLLPAQQSVTPASREALANIAEAYQKLSTEYVGEMPPIVAEFIRAYANPTDPANPRPAT